MISATDQDEKDDEFNILDKTPPIFDISLWLQSFNASIKSLGIETDKDLDKEQSISFLVQKWKIRYFDKSLIKDFNKIGLLSKSSIIRIMFWYQKILEQMFLLFKKRMNKLIQASNKNMDLLQIELDSFILNINELTDKCQIRISNCIISNTPDRIKQFQPLTQKQKDSLIDILIHSLTLMQNYYPEINYSEIAKQLKIDKKRAENYIFLKRNEIRKYLNDQGSLPKWMIDRYSQQLAILKMQANEQHK